MVNEFFVSDKVIKVAWRPAVFHVIPREPLPVAYFPEIIPPYVSFPESCAHQLEVRRFITTNKRFAWAYCVKQNVFFWAHPADKEEA